MTDQKDAFLTSEGDNWYSRNRVALGHKYSDNDEVICALRELKISPRIALEIGCANGWRLEKIRSASGASCYGIDPSENAIEEGMKEFPNLDLSVGTAEDLHFFDSKFDLVIYGFCLYLCDRDDLFRIGSEGDRVLANSGYMVIYDFHSDIPYRNRYKHLEGLYSYKMDYAKMFSWCPSYRQVYKKVFSHNSEGNYDDLDSLLSVTVFRKSTNIAFIDR